MDTKGMLYSSGISIGFYILYKTIQNLYHKYYLTSECHQRTLEITVVSREEIEEKKDHDIPAENPIENKK